MTRDDVAAWLDRYLAAWQSYDRDAIADLFAEDAAQRFRPSEEPAVGREAIVASWLDEERLDPPGSWEARYEPYAVEGDRAVVTGVTTYFEDGAVARVYDNVFALRFDGEGRCSELTEWFMLRP